MIVYALEKERRRVSFDTQVEGAMHLRILSSKMSIILSVFQRCPFKTEESTATEGVPRCWRSLRAALNPKEPLSPATSPHRKR